MITNTQSDSPDASPVIANMFSFFMGARPVPEPVQCQEITTHFMMEGPEDLLVHGAWSALGGPADVSED